jgi:hypothetical protein
VHDVLNHLKNFLADRYSLAVWRVGFPALKRGLGRHVLHTRRLVLKDARRGSPSGLVAKHRAPALAEG